MTVIGDQSNFPGFMSSNIDFSGYWKTELQTADGRHLRKALLLDLDAESSDPNKPAFMAPPPGSKPYHGFPLIRESSRDGFTLGVITNFQEADSDQGCSIGDAFVEGPDGSRAGLFWEVNSKEAIISPVQGPDENRWGIYYITIASPVKSLAELLQHFEGMIPILKQIYASVR